MHEHGIADQILKSLLQHRDRTGASRVVAATVRVSEIAGLSQPALQAALDHCCEHHQLDPIALTLQSSGLLAHCNSCDQVVAVNDEIQCVTCGSSEVRLCAGEAVVIESCECI